MMEKYQAIRPMIRRRSGLLFGLLLSLTACSLNNSPPTQFYLLEPTAAHDLEHQAPRQIIVLTPVKIAPYLNTTHIVTALGQNHYQVSDFHRWAEDLGDNVQRVLQQDLARLLPVDVLSQFSGDALHVALTVFAFHVDAQGEASLEVQWQLSKNKQLVKMGRGHFSEPVSVADYSSRVAAMNACLAQLTRALVSDIQAQLR